MDLHEVLAKASPFAQDFPWENKPHREWLTLRWSENVARVRSALQVLPSEGSKTAPRQLTHGPLVLVVDDEPVIAITLSEILHRHGFNAVWLTDPHAAADFLDCTALEMLITDIDMPSMDGLALATHAAQRNPGCSGHSCGTKEPRLLCPSALGSVFRRRDARGDSRSVA